MFFLVPYNIVDREDISLNQKMIAIYLARIQDEKGPNTIPSVAEIASKLKLSEDEVSLNLELLLSKGILSASQLEVRRAQFNEIYAENEGPREDTVAEEADKDEETETNPLMEALESAEERVRERAAQLRLNVRKKKRALNQAQAMEELERAAERLKESESESEARAGAREDKEYRPRTEGRGETYDEVDELLRLLQTSPRDESDAPEMPKKPEKEEQRLKNRNFMKVSSVYNSVKSSLPRNKADEKKPK